jgi:hypothetical protein
MLRCCCNGGGESFVLAQPAAKFMQEMGSMRMIGSAFRAIE